MACLASPVIVWASGTLNVSPGTDLSNGQVVTVSGSGFTANSTGSILECNDDPSQPTVEFAGNSIPVSCSNPLSDLLTTTNTGKVTATSFTVVTGTVGPPATGTDSSGGDAATDAANYPCPPTQSQVEQGYACDINFGDQANDDATQNLTFTTTYSGQGSGGGTSGGGSSSSSGGGSSSNSTSKGTSGKSTTKSTTTTAAASTPSTTPSTSSTPTQAAIAPSSPKISLPATAPLTIKVENSNNQPVSGVKVTLDNVTTQTTNQNGLTTFESIRLGSHSITVSNGSKVLATNQLTLSGDKDKLFSVKLSGLNISLVYFVVAGITVTLLGAGGFYFKRSHRSPEVTNPIQSGVLANNSSAPATGELPTYQPVQQVGQMVGPDKEGSQFNGLS